MGYFINRNHCVGRQCDVFFDSFLLYKRAEDFLGDLLNEGYKNVLIVTSKHVFRHFRNIIDQLDPREALGKNVQNAEILVREIC